MRNKDKIAARSKMDPKELAPIEERNRKIYGNKVGPTAERLFLDKKKKYLNDNIMVSDEQIWDKIIQGSMRKDEVINTLLGVKH